MSVPVRAQSVHVLPDRVTSQMRDVAGVFAVYKMEVIVRAQNLAVRDTHWGVVLFALVVILLA